MQHENRNHSLSRYTTFTDFMKTRSGWRVCYTCSYCWWNQRLPPRSTAQAPRLFMALNLTSLVYVLPSGVTTGMSILCSSIRTTSDIVGLTDGVAFVHRRAIFTTISISSLLALASNLGSMSSSMCLLSFKWLAYNAKECTDLRRIVILISINVNVPLADENNRLKNKGSYPIQKADEIVTRHVVVVAFPADYFQKHDSEAVDICFVG